MNANARSYGTSHYFILLYRTQYGLNSKVDRRQDTRQSNWFMVSRYVPQLTKMVNEMILVANEVTDHSLYVFNYSDIGKIYAEFLKTAQNVLGYNS